MAELGLRCGTWELLVASCGIYFPDQGWNVGPLHWECGVLSPGPPGKSPFGQFLIAGIIREGVSVKVGFGGGKLG